jgi:L-seryl-tRNA(Ser) seleniumtransferase
MLDPDPRPIAARCQALAQLLESAGADVSIYAQESVVGGGALPRLTLPSFAVQVRPARGGAGGLADRLAAGDPPVVARLRDGAVVLDLRTVSDPELPALAAAIRRAL